MTDFVTADQRDRRDEWRRRHLAEITHAARVAARRAALEVCVQRAAFLTGTADEWIRHAPAGWKVIFCADPNPAYRQHLTADSVRRAKDAGLGVGAWCGTLAMEHSGFDGPGARFAKAACEEFGLDFWVGQFETPVEFDDAMEHGATLGIGNPHAITAEQQNELRELLARGDHAYSSECYSNIPSWPRPDQYGAPIGLSPASLCLGVGRFDGGGPIPLREYREMTPPAAWRVTALYDSGMTADDFAVLP